MPCKYFSKCRDFALDAETAVALAPPHAVLTHLWACLNVSISVRLSSLLFSSHNSPLLRDIIFFQLKKKQNTQTNRGWIFFFFFFLLFYYHQKNTCAFEVELNVAAVVFGVIDVEIRNPAECAAIQRLVAGKQHRGRINNHICNFTHSSRRKPYSSSASPTPILLDPCPRLCSGTLGLGPTNLQALMGNWRRIQTSSKSG